MGKASEVTALNPTFNDKQLICVGGRVKVSDIFTNRIIIQSLADTIQLLN